MEDSVPTRKRGRPRKITSIDADRLRSMNGVCRCGTLMQAKQGPRSVWEAPRGNSGQAAWCFGTMGIRSGEPDGRSGNEGRKGTYRRFVAISSSKEEVDVEDDMWKTSIMDERTSGGCTELCKCETLVHIVHKPRPVQEYTKEFLDMAEKCKSKLAEGGEDGREGDGSKGLVVKQVIMSRVMNQKKIHQKINNGRIMRNRQLETRNAAVVAFKNGRVRIEAPVRLSHAESWREGAVIHCKGYTASKWLVGSRFALSSIEAHGRNWSRIASLSIRTHPSFSLPFCRTLSGSVDGTPVGNGEGAGVTGGVFGEKEDEEGRKIRSKAEEVRVSSERAWALGGSSHSSLLEWAKQCHLV
ncbi:hypothetical protein DY000_02020635 [Brassica cretica]|uniref:Uncharacterized protein n=1 Tax=Brassica cretica TaxID=69181 RepID=A0ABQ7E030_BRACR|nr:hypothetical protein DY000_02020635 [Brassica cretica]